MDEGYYFTPDNTVGDLGDETFAYELLPDGTYSIRLRDKNKCPESIVIPGSIESGSEVTNDNDTVSAEAVYTIPISVSAIADRGFSDCKDLTSIFIPKSVTFIGEEAFFGSGLTEITVDAENPVFHSEGNCIINTAEKTVVAGCSGSVIPNDGSVTAIGDSAFSGSLGLSSMRIPSHVHTIGQLAFHKCKSMKTIELEAGVETIAYGAFSSCDSLTEIKIPEGVRFIGAIAFSKCKDLRRAIIPSSVEIIGGDIFSECESISEVIFEGSRSRWKEIHRADIIDSGRNDYVVCKDEGKRFRLKDIFSRK